MFEIKQMKKYLAIKTVILYKADLKISLSWKLDGTEESTDDGETKKKRKDKNMSEKMRLAQSPVIILSVCVISISQQAFIFLIKQTYV